MPSHSVSDHSVGLVLSGGGARGAYQAGVLKALGQICRVRNIKWPFQIMTGLSAGAINCAYLACSPEDFYRTTDTLSKIWSEIRADDVFRTDPASLSHIGVRWVSAVMTGGFALSDKPQSLVDTTPLRKLISRFLSADAIQKNIEQKKFEAVCVSATEYASSRCVSFVQSNGGKSLWEKPARYAVAANLKPDHVMASSAIPVLFPAIKIDSKFYGDGCLRNLTPLSPALRLGAYKLFVIGVRKDLHTDSPTPVSRNGASAGRILSVLLNAVLMDGLESDLENLQTINHLLGHFNSTTDTLRTVPIFIMRPSTDIAELALGFTDAISPLVRYLTHGLGPMQQTAEMISYLLFEPEFCRSLIELGHADTMAQAEDIGAFLES